MDEGEKAFVQKELSSKATNGSGPCGNHLWMPLLEMDLTKKSGGCSIYLSRILMDWFLVTSKSKRKTY